MSDNGFIQSPQDEFLFERYNSVPTGRESEAQSKRIGSWMVEDVNAVPAAKLEADQVGLADSSRVEDTKTILADDTIPMEQKAVELTDLATAQGTKDNASAVQGMAQALAASEGEALPAVVASRRAWIARTNAAQERVRAVVERAQAEALDRMGSDLPGVAGAAVGTARYVGNAVAAFAFPEFSIELVNIAKKYAPDFNAGDYLTPKDLFNAVGRNLRLMEPDEAEQAAKDIVALVEDQSGTLFGENPFETKEMVQTLLESAYDSKTNWRNAAQILDVLSLVPIAGSAAKVAATGVLVGLDAAPKIGAAAVKGVAKFGQQVGEGALKAPTNFITAKEVLSTRKLSEVPVEVYKTRAEDLVKETFGHRYRASDITLGENGVDVVTRLGPKPNKGYATEQFARNIAKDKVPEGASFEIVNIGDEFFIEAKQTLTIDDLVPVDDTIGAISQKIGAEGANLGRFGGARITVGTASDAATMTSAGARKAINELGKDTGDATLTTAGTSSAEVAGSLVTPKISTNVDELNRPYIEDIYLRPEMRAQVAERVKAGLLDRFQTRLKDTKLTTVEGGQQYEAMIGASDGRGYAKREYLEGLAADQFKGLDYSIVQEGDRFFVKLNGFEPNSIADIKADADLVKAGGFWRQMFGKSAAFTQHFIETSNAAVRQSDLAAGVATRAMKPYHNLMSWQRTKINKLLEVGETEGKVFSREEAIAKGLSPKEYKGYNAVQRLVQHDLAMTNFNTRTRLTADGYLETTIDGMPAMLRKIDRELPANARVVDLTTGKPVTAKAVEGVEKRVYEFFDETSGGYQYGVALGKKPISVRPLPQQVIKNIPGYTGTRRYTYSHYVRERLPDGSTRALRGARGTAEAQKLIAEETAKNPNVIQSPFAASEISDLPAMFDDMQRLKDQGLSYTSHRRPDLITGVDGKAKTTGIEESVNQMVHRYGTNGGLTRWTDYMTRTLNATYGDLGVHFSLGSKPTLVAGVRKVVDQKRYNEALTIWNHVQRTNGVSAIQLSPTLTAFRNSVADAVYTAAGRVERVSATAAKPVFSLADNISGVSDSLTVATKSAAFASFLGTNVFRNWFTQSSMIPTYLGVRGGLGYAMGGSFSKDMITLQLAKVAPDMARKINPKLVDEWVASGMDEAVENHAYTIGTIGDARHATSGVLGDTVGRTVNVLKRVGMDVGIRADKRASFLMSLNRWKVDHGGKGPINQEEWQKVVSFGESIAMNQNRADSLPLSNGVLGLMMQFQSHHVKSWGRIMGLETGFTKAEKARMQVLGLLTYGMDGYRIGDLVDKAEAQGSEKWHPDVKELVRQGIGGSIFNHTMRAALDDKDKGERSAIDISGSISPTNFAGPDLNYITELFGITLSTAHANIPFTNAAGLGLITGASDVVNFAMAVGGKLDMPPDEKALAITKDFFRKFPITNNVIKAYAAYNLGVKIDSKGSPVVESTKAEAIASILGLQSYKETELNEGMNLINGEFVASQDDDALDGALDEEAEKYGAIIAQAISEVDGPGRSVAEIEELVYNHAVSMKSALGETETLDYFNKLIRVVEKRGVSRNEKFVESLMSKIAVGKVRASGDLITQLDAINLPGVDAAKQFVRDQQDASSYIQQYLQEQ